MDDSAEFYEDFGAAPPSEAELARLVERARAAGDAELRKALKHYGALRWAAAELVAHVEAREGTAAFERDARLRLARVVAGAGPAAEAR